MGNLGYGHIPLGRHRELVREEADSVGSLGGLAQTVGRRESGTPPRGANLSAPLSPTKGTAVEVEANANETSGRDGVVGAVMR